MSWFAPVPRCMRWHYAMYQSRNSPQKVTFVQWLKKLRNKKKRLSAVRPQKGPLRLRREVRVGIGDARSESVMRERLGQLRGTGETRPGNTTSRMAGAGAWQLRHPVARQIIVFRVTTSPVTS
jgi:hypothetical protein